MGNRKDNVELAIDTLKQMLTTMNYGSITLVVQDHVVVQIEKNEKIRLK
nr:YezD family protein [Sporosarcina sp. YIM B06819]